MKLSGLVFLLLLVLICPTEAKNGTTSVQSSIGGINLGTQGSTGIYSGYTLVGGDQFDGLLSIVHIDLPYARYLETHNYYAGARSISGNLQNSYDIDPYHTGSQDSHRGSPVGTNDTMVQSNGLTLKARTANSSETPYINGRIISAAMFTTGSYLTFTPPAIIEGYISFNQTPSNAPLAWHPTFWIQSASPLDSCDNCPSPGGQEYDFPEVFQNSAEFNYNYHGGGGFVTVSSNSLPTSFMGTGLHLFSLVMTNTSIQGYIDGVLQATILQDTTNSLRPYQVLFTNHTFQNSAINLTTWNALGVSGAQINMAYYRVWLPNSEANQIVRPTSNLPTMQVGYNTPFIYTFPSPGTLWSKTVTSDYCLGLRYEDEEPGATGEGTTEYYPFPAELTWNSTTRVLSGSVTSRPGRLHVGCIPYLIGGSLGYTARGYIDVGPNITSTSLNYSNGSGSLDMYYVGDCGTLVPKTMTVTGLPSGLTFSPTTFLITGTASQGSYVITMMVTNYVGQSESQNITLEVGP